MDPLPELTEWIEGFYDEATSFGLEIAKEEDTSFKTWRKGQFEDADPSQAAQIIIEWARQFRQNNPDAKYHAFVRYRTDDGKSTKTIRNFLLPMPKPTGPNPFALTKDDLDDNPGLKIFMQLVDGERRRTEQALFVSRQREDKLFDTMIKTIETTGEDRSAILQEMREERTMLLQEMREERQSHRDSIGPILEQSANALANAAELVKVHQEKNTQVQLAELEYKSDKEKMEMYLALGGPMLKKLAGRVNLRKHKKKKPKTEETEGTVDQEDQEPPTTGPTRQLFFILEKLGDDQINDVKRLLGDKMFDVLDDAAHSGSDAQTHSALAQLKEAYDQDPKGMHKLLQLAMVLGEDLSEKFLSLMEGESDDEDEAGDDADGGGDEDSDDTPKEADVIPLRKKEGYVQGLRDAGFADLTEDQQVEVAQQLGGELTGVLIAAAEGQDEDKAFAALCTLGARLNELAKETDETEAEKRLDAVIAAIGDDPDESKLIALIAQAAGELEP